jgi:formylmethanofuran dehydrogenase subunit E
LGAAALNGLISFIDTGKKARDVMRRGESPSIGFHVQPELRESDSAVSLVFSARF